MKYYLLFLMLVGVSLADAQNYKCVQANQVPFFTNVNGYLRALRIDSVRTLGSDTVYYPYRCSRNTSITTENGSWLSNRVVHRPDGTFYFRTAWGDTVIIKTQANVGDMWMLYNDTSARSYTGRVTLIDTMTFNGILDSVKKIRLTGYMGSTIDPGDVLNDFEIIISKDHGFVQIFDLYLFPYRTPTGAGYYDFFEDQIGALNKPNFTFIVSDYHIPTEKEVYTFNNGDVFITRGWTYREFPELSWHIYDSVISKTSPDTWRDVYKIYRINRITTSYTTSWSPPGPSYTDYYIGEIELTVDTSLIFDNWLPEQYPTRVWYYRPDDSSWCGTGSFYKTDDVVTFEGGPNIHEYKTGYEKLLDATHVPPMTMDEIGFHSTRESNLIFSNKSGITCGTRWMPGNVEEVAARNPAINIFPNPATNSLHVSSAHPIALLFLTDMTGRRVYAHTGDTQELTIDIGALPPGIFMLWADGYVQRIAKQ